MNEHTHIRSTKGNGWRTPLCSCGCRKEARYVGRGTIFGNPFRIGDEVVHNSPDGLLIINVTSAEIAVELYVKWLNKWPTEFAGVPEPLHANIGLPAIRGHDLMCWCALDQPCHADELLRIANG